MKRRDFLYSSLLMSGAAIGAGALFGRQAQGAEGDFPVKMTEDQWRAKLSADQFAILRQEATERPFTSPLLENKQHGLYACAGCDTPVYSSETKFDSGTGWPSYWEAIEGSVATTVDYKLVYARTEVHCATCGGHLGHIFDDGPQPTGKRHCINGIVLNFKPTPAAS